MGNVDSYVKGSSGSNTCPAGSVIASEVECRCMPGIFGGQANSQFRISSGVDPKGCFRFSNWWYYNTHSEGVARHYRSVYCSHAGHVKYQVVGDGTNGCPGVLLPLSITECRRAADHFH